MDETFTLDGHGGALAAARWDSVEDEPRYVVLLCHGYGEHIGRYEYVAQRLAADGAVVYGLDHVGHGRSDGERVLIEDLDDVVRDFHLLARRAELEQPGLPIVLIGHSMGGLIGARYIQEYGDELRCAVLSGPLLGRSSLADTLLALPEIPDVPIDPAVLSRDPKVGAAYQADELVWHGPFKRPTLEALKAAGEKLNQRGTLPVPTAWLHGLDDELVPYAESKAGWEIVRPDRGFERAYPGARHEIFNETNKDAVLDDVQAFINTQL